MNDCQTKMRGITLIELLMVLVLVTIFAGAVVTSTAPAVDRQLIAAARMIAADVDYCRSLATTYNSQYKVKFFLDTNKYRLKHIGSNTSLDDLPNSPLNDANPLATRIDVFVADIPGTQSSVKLAGVVAGDGTIVVIDTVKFGPYGETVESTPTVIWLKAGPSGDIQYIPITINPITGLAEVGAMQNSLPVGVVAEPVI